MVATPHSAIVMSNPWLKTAPTASGRRWPTRRAVRIWIPSTSDSGRIRNNNITASATAIAPSSVIPTWDRNSVSIRWSRVSVASTKMIGMETFQTTRERRFFNIGTHHLKNYRLAGLARPALQQLPMAAPGSGGQRDLIAGSVEVHHHARQQCATLMKFAE